MNSVTDKLRSARYQEGWIRLEMASGLIHSFPVSGNPRLATASEEQLANMEISPFGIHWPDLDEDLSFAGIAKGDFGQG